MWLLAGVVIGALVTGLVRLSRTPEPDNATTIADSAREKNPGMAKGEDEDASGPRFDFYTLLKETEVIVPDKNREQARETGQASDSGDIDDTSTRPEVTSETTVSPPDRSTPDAADPGESGETPDPEPGEDKDEVVYVLQAGSFQSAEDADSVRARLLLLDMQASVEKVSPNPGETWHRVLVGPFSSKTELGEARAVLTRNGIDSIQLKRRL